MSFKRSVLKITFLTLIVILLIILSIVIINKYFFAKEIDTSKSSKTNVNDVSDNSKETIKKEEKEKTENKEKQEEKAEQKDVNVQDNKVENTPKVNIIPKGETDNKKTEEQTPSSNNHNSSSVTPPISQQPVEQTPSCTPKKFYTVFRADFESEEKCNEVYEYYHDIDPNKYLGHICSDQADDCGVIYYQLTFFDINENYFGYDEI